MALATLILGGSTSRSSSQASKHHSISESVSTQSCSFCAFSMLRILCTLSVHHMALYVNCHVSEL